MLIKFTENSFNSELGYYTNNGKLKIYLRTKLPKWLMDEEKYPGKVEMPLQLKTESPANQWSQNTLNKI